MDASERDRLLGILHSDDFMLFMQEVPSEYESKEDFIARKMPQDIDPELMWELVSFERRMRGRPFVKEILPTAERFDYERTFWTATPDMTASINRIVSRTSAASGLWTSLSKLTKRKPILKFLVEDLSAACTRDGIVIDYDTLQSLVFEERKPSGTTETVVGNAIGLLFEMDSHPAQPLNVPMLHELCARLTSGLTEDDATILDHPWRSGPSPVSPERLAQSREVFQADIERNGREYDDWGIHPLFRLLLNSDIVWECAPFPHFNGLMEVITRTYSFRSIGVPALCVVPLSKLRLDWELHMSVNPVTSLPYGGALIETSFGNDTTPYLAQIIRLLDRGVERVVKAVDAVEAADAECETIVEQDARLTYRQKVLLIEMLHTPGLVTDIKSYEDRFDVAMSTARTDLLRMVSMGYLLTEFRAKKQVFWPRPDLMQILMARKPASS